MKEIPINLHIAVPGLENFSFGHHGGIHDLSIAIKDSDDSLKMLIEMLPKKAKELEEISAQSPDSERMFFNMVRQSFRYLQTIIDLQDIKKDKLGTQEHRDSDDARGRCHDATVDSVNAWSRSLFKNNIDNSFMAGVLSTPPNRAVYGMFAVGLVSDIYTDKDFDIEKYSK
jgi:hypothetical protein